MKVFFILLSVLSLGSFKAQAGSSITLNNITPTQFDQMAKEMAANFNYSTITPASSLGKIWGVELGVVGGITKAPNTLSFVQIADPATSMKANLPHANIIARVGIPYGMTFEAMGFPKKTISSLTTKSYGLALQWTVTDLFFTELPFFLATKAFYSKTSLNFAQTFTVSGVSVPGTVSLTDSNYGLQAAISKRFLFLEPYLVVGYGKTSASMSVSPGSLTYSLLSSTYTTTNATATSSPKTVFFLLGTDAQIAFFSLGAEYQRSYGTSSYSGRVSFRF